MMSPQNDNAGHDLPPNTSDHDLLIVLYTTMRHMSRDISSIKDDNTQRLAVIEQTKYDKEDATKALAAADRIHDELRNSIKTRASKEDLAGTGKTLEDHEKRMRTIERNMYIAIGALTLLQIALKFVPLGV